MEVATIFDGAGAFDDLGDEFQFAALKKGWGIPTATDICIGWSAALLVFGKGHPESRICFCWQSQTMQLA